MKARKSIALMMVLMMLIQYIPVDVWANPQNQVTDVWFTEGIGHTRDPVSDAMKPSIHIGWVDPGVAPGENPGTIDPGNPNHEHQTQFYQVELTEIGRTGAFRSQPIPAVINQQTYTASLTGLVYGYDAYGQNPEGQYSISNGAFYKMRIIATHIHQLGEDQVAPPSLPVAKESYFVTDFDTQVEVVDEGLRVSFEYIPGVTYNLTYVEGVKNTVSQVEEGNLENTITIEPNEARQMESDGRVYYTLENLKSQQAYSMYVQFAGYDQEIVGTIEYNTRKDASGPKVVSEITPITLRVTQVGGGMIEIYWGDISGITNGNPLEYIQILAHKEAGPDRFEVVAQTNDTLGTQMSIIIEEPQEDTVYKVVFKFQNDYADKESNEYVYEKNIITIPPHTPKIPTPFGPYVDRTDKDIDETDYLVTGDERVWVDAEGKENADLLEDFLDNSFHGKEQDKAEIQIVWDIPRRQDENNEIDFSLAYDIWVVESMEELQGDTNVLPKVVDTRSVDAGDITKLITHHANSREILGIKWALTEYLDSTTGEIVPLEKNKTYFIQVVAKRELPELDASGQIMYVESEPAIVGITIDKDGNIYPPPVIGKPPMHIKEGSITENSMTVQWRTSWLEVVAKHIEDYNRTSDREQVLAEIGSSLVYTPAIQNPPVITTGPAIRYEEQEAHDMHLLFDDEDVEKLITAVNSYENGKNSTTGIDYFDEDYYTKSIVLEDDLNYEVEVLEYTDLESRMQLAGKTTIEEWIRDIASNDDRSGLKWDAMEPEVSDEEGWLEFDVTHHTPSQRLQPNTRYVIMIRVYRMIGDEKVLQSFPTYVIGTTLTDFEGPEPIPTTPDLYLNLEEGTLTDTSFEVYWKYNKDFDYEIRYSTKDDPTTANVWQYTIVEDAMAQDTDNQIYHFVDGKDAYLTLDGLFPETTYNVWIKAHQKKGNVSSEFSTPVTARTLEMGYPDMPTGLGVASNASLEEIGIEDSATGEDYIIIEWKRDPNDKGKETQGTVSKWYEYDIEYADNMEFVDSVTVTATDSLTSEGQVQFLAKNIAKINGLLPNQPYYVRVKTRLVMIDSSIGGEISKESQYCSWVRIMTSKTEGEFDGGENDNIVTFPSQYEETFEDGIWELEIKDTQGVITEIIESNAYVYLIEMDLYNDRYDARLRRITMPAPVLQALIGQRMELRVQTHAGEYRIPARALSYKVEMATSRDTIQFDFETLLAYDLGDMAKAYPYILEQAEELRIYLKSDRSVNGEITYFDTPVDIALKLEEADGYLSDTYKTYVYDYAKGGWVYIDHGIQVREDGTYLNYRVNKTGMQTMYRVDTYHQPNSINYSMQQLLSNYTIPELGITYKVDDVVHSNQFIHLILGLALGNREISLDAPISEQARQQALITKIYTQGTPSFVTEEVAINGVIRLYEMKTGYPVIPANVNVSHVASQYRESVGKAYALGLITEITPNKQVSYGTLSTWIQMVLPN